MSDKLARPLILAFSFLFSLEASPINGKVVDPLGLPLPGVQVSVNGRAEPIISDEKGEFAIAAPATPGGRVTVTFSKKGFLTLSQQVELDAPLAAFVLQIEPVKSSVTVDSDSGYLTPATASATKTLTPLRDVPQAITIIGQQQIQDQMMMSIADVVRYVPGISAHQGENNRDQLIIRGNSTSADFFVNGVRDDVQYYRDLYNLDRVEALKGPNALIFGRGGAGGVINRVTKEAGFTPVREFTLSGGSFENKRVSADFDQPVNDKLTFRLNGMYEDAGSFRKYVNLERYGVSPTLTWTPGTRTKVVFAYENFHDFRVADRGISSFAGRPIDVPSSTYIGNPRDSHVRANVNLGSTLIEQQIGRLNIRNRTQVGAYDRGYQNYVPGVVAVDRSTISISAYNNATARLNVFNQTDFTYTVNTGVIHHTLLAGMEIGRQVTDNFRNTGYFNNSAISMLAPYQNPVVDTPVTFRQSAADADNHVKVNLGSVYVQDQVELSRRFQLVGGLRLDHFDLRYRNNRISGGLGDLRRIDNLLSPRAGLVFKPVDTMTLYTSYSISYLPSSGDQFSSLTTVTAQVKPEHFINYEIGLKWDVTRLFALTSAVYRLDRTNTRSTDPNDPARIVQTGSQRTNGFEMGFNGGISRRWKVVGGYGYQDAFVTSATASAKLRAQVAQVPHHTFSLWNNYQIVPRLGVGLGVVNRSEMFAAIDDAVRLAGYARVDAAVFVRLTERLRVQANVENVTDRRYYANADNNTNISPGGPRAFRVGLVARF